MRVLHQLLHGYSDGHRQLAGSVRLQSPGDQKRVLVYSDLSGPGRPSVADGYLTGYPLPESGLYAIARTWRAEEMARPGCVWTHTILIAFSDLAALGSPEALAKLFVRPAGIENQLISSVALEAYSVPLTVDFDQLERASNIELTYALADLLRELYLAPFGAVIAPRARFDDPDAIVLRIWAQQWPRLRRSFRFCSLVTADRSFNEEIFDLQLSEESHWTVRAVEPRKTDRAIKDLSDRWLGVALHGLGGAFQPEVTSFLRMIGSELQSGRAAFAPLIELFTLIAGGDHSTVDGAIRVFTNHKDEISAPKLVDIIVRFALLNGGPSQKEGWAFVVSHANKTNFREVPDETMRDLASRAWSAGWFGPDVDFGDAATSEFVAALAPHFSYSVLSSVSDRILSGVLQLVPRLASTDSFMLLPRERIESVLVMAVYEDPEIVGDILKTAIRFPSRELAAACLVSTDVLTLLAELNNREVSSPDDPWVEHAIKDPDSIARFLHSTPSVQKSLLESIAEASSPGMVPNIVGPDPWLVSVNVQATDLGPCLAAYLFARGFAGDSKSASDLVFGSFSELHNHIAQSRLSNRHWQWLDKVLPQLDEYRGWDRCLRLRSAVAKRIIDADFDLGRLLRLTSDDQLLSYMIMSLRSVSGGKRYVRSMLKDMSGIYPAELPRAKWLREATT